ncbi:hypothetical protein FQR65_LT16002 [Abscondita terminalis]|nr:hypothetical protein FQR65_LT16002 [Abscondita terminalis]
MTYLNEQNVERVNILHSSIYVNNKGDIKLYDYGLESLIVNTICVNNPDQTNTTYTFGILLISLLQGKLIETNEIPNLPIDYQQFLSLCPETDSVNELLNNVLPEIDHTFELIKDPEDLNASHYKRNVSKLNKDFEIIKKIGKGAFGKVYQIQDNVDLKHYALKKIKLSNNEDDNNIIDEVKYLSQLEHKHIVRYYHAWRNYEDTDDSDTDDDDEDDITDDYYIESSGSGIKTFCIGSSDYIENAEENITNLLINCTLYIKMEYCEGNTLEHVINETNLYKSSTRIWKYFKEIVKGLQHIHDKNIIHRDLKPSNIFLDSNNHIKIGDFGFATNKLRYRSIEKENSETTTDGGQSYTTRAGTHYYKAPELNSSNSVICNNKLDMYSLGIILFEMCYHRFDTDSERARVLSELRTVEIIFPNDFNKSNLFNQNIIIRDLLNHNDKLRPSCQDLMESNLIPHLLEEKEEEKQLLAIKRIANNPNSSLFHHFFTYCFQRENVPLSQNVNFQNATFLEAIIKIITDIFRKHGGQNYETTSQTLHDTCVENCTRCIKAVNGYGKAFVVPCNSRLPFLKYTILKNHFWIKRYSVEKSFTCERSCDFDIITPINLRRHNCYIPDAELLLILYELISAFPNVHSGDFTLSISHTDLIEVILKECTIVEDPMNNIIFCFAFHDLVAKRRYLSEVFNNYRYDDHIKFAKMFSNFPKTFHLPTNEFKHFEAWLKADRSLTELMKIIEVAKELGVTCDINVDVCIDNFRGQYSGMIVQLSHKSSLKQDHIPIGNRSDHIAIGGRYDQVLESVCQFSKSKRYGVGLSIYPERLNAIIKGKQSLNLSEVLIYIDSNNVLPEVHKVLRVLWENNIACSFIKMANAKYYNKYCFKNKYLCVIKVNLKLLNEEKVQIIYRKHPYQKCEIGIKNLVLMTKTLLQLEPVDQILLEGGSEVPILFKTKASVSFLEKAKYKCEVT